MIKQEKERKANRFNTISFLANENYCCVYEIIRFGSCLKNRFRSNFYWENDQLLGLIRWISLIPLSNVCFIFKFHPNRQKYSKSIIYDPIFDWNQKCLSTSKCTEKEICTKKRMWQASKAFICCNHFCEAKYILN